MGFAGWLKKHCMDLLFPPVCPVCRIRLDPCCPGQFCHRCLESIRYLLQPLCRVCGMELVGPQERDQLCGECLRSPPPYCLARSLVRYEPAVRQLVQRLKYAGDTSVVPGLAEIIGCCDLTVFADCQWILPVPLHLDRHRGRGLNQATVLAHLFFPEQQRIIQPDWLIRVRNTPAQTTLGGIERRKNLAGAFQVRPGSLPEPAMVCLVDDVFTTGTTVGECAGALKRHGRIEVKVLTLARAGAPQRGRWK